MIPPHRHHSPTVLHAQSLVLIALVVAPILAARSDGSAGAGPVMTEGNVRVSTHDFFPNDPFFSPTGAPDVLQQNEPSVAVHPLNPNLIAVGMNDVRTLGISDDAWQGLAVSTNGGASFDFEALVPGFPGDTSPAGLASPVRGNQAASDPWLSFDDFGNLFFAFIAFQRTPPGRPDFDPAETNVIAVAKYIATPGGVQYHKTVVVERGTVGLGRQEDKEALAVDNHPSLPFNGNIYVCWARFTGFQDHLKVARSTDHGESYAMSDVGPVRNMQGCNVTAAPNGDVYVSWRTFDSNPRNSNPQDSAIFVARSADGGATFGDPVRVAAFADYRQIARRSPAIFRIFSVTWLAADEHGVYVAWHQRSGANGADALISRSTTNGSTWEAPVRPHAGFGHQLTPSIAAGGGRLSVVWYDSRSEPAFTPAGPVSAQCPPDATIGQRCTGMDVFYNQADTSAPGPLAFRSELRVTDRPFNPNLFGSIKAITPFIGDDNRDINPSANAQEDASTATDPPELVNARSRDSNIYFQRIIK